MSTTTTETWEVSALGATLEDAGWTRDAAKPWPLWESPNGEWRVEAHGGDAGALSDGSTP